MKQKLLEKINKFRKNRFSYTLLVVPNRGQKIKSWKIPYRMMVCLLGTVILFFCLAAGFVYHYTAMCGKMAELTRLRKTNVLQVEQLKELEKTVDEVDQKLQALDELDQEIREMVELDHDEAESLRESGHEPDGSGTAALQVRLAGASRSADEKISSLRDLKTELPEKLRYLAALPTYWPVLGRVTSEFGYRKSLFSSRQEFHSGIDIAARYGSSVHAAGSGRVVFSGWQSAYGRMVKIDHGYGVITCYAHNSANLVNVGDEVQKGEVIARLGSTGRSTGPHLHYGVELNGQPVDPRKYLE